MRVEFSLPIKAFSLNAYRYGHSPHKTKAARDYEAEVLSLLSKKHELELMADMWRKNIGYNQIQVWITHVYPKAVFYNKAGNVSAKTFDLSNTEKIILDLIINRHMGLDDRHVTQLVSSKESGECFEVRVCLELSRL